MGIAVKIFNLDTEGNLSLGARVDLSQGKYYMYKAIGKNQPVRVEILDVGELIWFAYLTEHTFPGEQNWEHQKLLIPLPGSMESVEKQAVESCLLITQDETLLIRMGEVRFLLDNTAVFFQSGVKPTFH